MMVPISSYRLIEVNFFLSFFACIFSFDENKFCHTIPMLDTGVCYGTKFTIENIGYFSIISHLRFRSLQIFVNYAWGLITWYFKFPSEVSFKNLKILLIIRIRWLISSRCNEWLLCLLSTFVSPSLYVPYLF